MSEEQKPELIGKTIDELPWPDDVPMPPTDLPYDDGDPIESPWHFGNSALLVSSYVALHGGRRDNYYIGANMFIYYSDQQAYKWEEYRGPDIFITLNVDGTRPRNSWIIWEEGGGYPHVIFELLSPSTEARDLGEKKQLYEKVFRIHEYFCVAPEVERLFGWRRVTSTYSPIEPDERGWIWSQQLNLWIGAWHGSFLGLEHTWIRFYDAAGNLVLTGEEAALQRAETAEQQLAAERQRVADLEAELRRLRGE